MIKVGRLYRFSVVILFLVITRLVGLTVAAGSVVEDKVNLLPVRNETGIWTISESNRTLLTKDLASIKEINKHLLLEFGFAKGERVIYKYGSSYITAELFHMNDAPAAYGIYTLLKSESGEDMAVGTESSFSGFNLMFWKGNVFVNLTASDCNGATMQSLVSFATIIDKKLNNIVDANPPDIIDLMYSETLMPVDIKFFRGWTAFSDVYLFPFSQFFTINEGIAADYGAYKVVLFHYNSDQDALNSCKLINNSLIRAPSFKNKNFTGNFIKMTDVQGRVISFEAFDNYVIMMIKKQEGNFNQNLLVIKKNIRNNSNS